MFRTQECPPGARRAARCYPGLQPRREPLLRRCRATVQSTMTPIDRQCAVYVGWRAQKSRGQTQSTKKVTVFRAVRALGRIPALTAPKLTRKGMLRFSPPLMFPASVKPYANGLASPEDIIVGADCITDLCANGARSADKPGSIDRIDSSMVLLGLHRPASTRRDSILEAYGING